VHVEEADLLTFDRFGESDVTYYYGPSDDAIQARFEHGIEDALRPGGIVVANRKLTVDFKTSGDFRVLSTDGPDAVGAAQEERRSAPTVISPS
jgi:hypothetical protein